MAFRREILQDHPWDERVIMCEESELFNRLTANGYTYLYVPAMRVSHFVPAARCTVEWVLARHHAEGLMQKHVRHGFLRKARVLVRASLGLLRSIAYLLSGAQQHRLFHRCRLQLQIGIFEGFLNVGGVPTVYPERFKPPKSG
jgi:GT2 family glycosyltransferase